jgi:hypothetical protein
VAADRDLGTQFVSPATWTSFVTTLTGLQSAQLQDGKAAIPYVAVLTRVGLISLGDLAIRRSCDRLARPDDAGRGTRTLGNQRMVLVVCGGMLGTVLDDYRTRSPLALVDQRDVAHRAAILVGPVPRGMVGHGLDPAAS